MAPEDGPLVVTKDDKVIVIETPVPASRLPSPSDPALSQVRPPRIVPTKKDSGVKTPRKSSSESTSNSFLKFFGRRRSSGPDVQDRIWVENRRSEVITVVVSMLGPNQKAINHERQLLSEVNVVDLDHEVSD